MVFDSFDKRYKRPFGAATAGEALVFSVKTERREAVTRAQILFTNDDGAHMAYPMEWEDLEDGYDRYGVKLKAPEAGLWFYAFCFETARGKKYAGPGRGEVPLSDGEYRRQLTVYEKDFSTPGFVKGGVIYHIFVDRFARSGNREGPGIVKKDKIIFHEDVSDPPVYKPDGRGVVQNTDFFGGSIPGITEKLPYLFELGVTALYLSPIFMARSNHKYDTGDYERIDPMFGTLDDFKELCEKAGEKGIRVILDGVFNHTGDDSKYFNKYGTYPTVGAYQSKTSPYYRWYSFKSYPDLYDSWWGITTLPAVNDENESFREFMTGEKGIVRRWLRFGASGWRLDVADELSDGFLEDIRAAAKAEKEDALLLGEVWEDASNKVAYGRRRRYFAGKQLDSVMNYPLKDAIIAFVKDKNAKTLQSVMDTLYENYPKCVLDAVMNILGTHDTPRILTVLGEEDITRYSRDEKASRRLPEDQRGRAVRLLKLATVLQMTLPGVPAVFYGDEAGLEGFEDPFNRRFYPWGREDREILKHYKALIKIRRGSAVLATGDYECLYAEGGVFLFARTCGEDVLVVGVNVSNEPFAVPCESPLTNLWTGEETAGKIEIGPEDFVLCGGKLPGEAMNAEREHV